MSATLPGGTRKFFFAKTPNARARDGLRRRRKKSSGPAYKTWVFYYWGAQERGWRYKWAGAVRPRPMAHKRTAWTTEAGPIAEENFSKAKRARRRNEVYVASADPRYMVHRGPVRDPEALYLALAMTPGLHFLRLSGVDMSAAMFARAFSVARPANLRTLIVGFLSGNEDWDAHPVDCSSLEHLEVDGAGAFVEDAGPFDVRTFGRLTDLTLDTVELRSGFLKMLADGATSLRRLSLHYALGSLEEIDEVLRMPLVSFRTAAFIGLDRLREATALEALEVQGDEGCLRLPHVLQHVTALTDLSITFFTRSQVLSVGLSVLPRSLQRLRVHTEFSQDTQIGRRLGRLLSGNSSLTQFDCSRPGMADHVLKACPGVICVPRSVLSYRGKQLLKRNIAAMYEQRKKIAELALSSKTAGSLASKLPLDCWNAVLEHLPENFAGGKCKFWFSCGRPPTVH